MIHKEDWLNVFPSPGCFPSPFHWEQPRALMDRKAMALLRMQLDPGSLQRADTVMSLVRPQK